mmetsp:Transcript_284/g.515  ORF Transcript_284/g.515 Transcript_284/m.515 type:complete len:138 (+) Transcript_284:448-861(+)
MTCEGSLQEAARLVAGDLMNALVKESTGFIARNVTLTCVEPAMINGKQGQSASMPSSTTSALLLPLLLPGVEAPTVWLQHHRPSRHAIAVGRGAEQRALMTHKKHGSFETVVHTVFVGYRLVIALNGLLSFGRMACS